MRVEGYVLGDEPLLGRRDRESIEVDTIEDVEVKTAIRDLLLGKHPGTRVEFR